MHTCRDVITLALKKLGVLRSGGEPKAADAADAMASLQSYYMSCVNAGTFGRVYNVQVSQEADLTAGGNQHFNVLTEDVVTVDLPASLPACTWRNWNPCGDYGWGWFDAAYSNPELAVPKDKSVVMITDQFGDARPVYIYDGTVQRWLRLDTMTLNDEAPLSARNFDGLASVLALRMSELFGSTLVSPVTLQSATQYRMALVSSFGNGDECYC